MYARVENNVVVEYPLYEGDIQRRFPVLQYPMETYNTPLPEGYVRVTAVEWPQPSSSTVEVREDTPVFDSVLGTWKQSFTEVPFSQEVINSRRTNKIREMRVERLRKLTATDWTRLDDCPLTTIQKAAFAQYRQELRDLTNDPNWPFVDWPTPPGVQR